MSKKCFLICPIGEAGSEIRRISDIVLKYIVTPACQEFDYDVIRSDTEFTVNSINEDIFNHLDNDELAIADLTGLNPNVFYEAGYRKAKGLPLIHIAREGTALPFDIKTIRTYFYDIDIDKADSAKNTLIKVIGNIQPENRKIVQKAPQSATVQNEGITKDAKKLLKALYKEYENKKSHGLSRSEAAAFNDIAEICRLSDMSVDDVRELYKELSEYGYLEYQASDMFEMVNSSLTGKGIKYGEDNFDEPTYIILLREIIKKCDSHNAIVSSQSFNNFSPEDFSILKAKGYIDVPKSLSKSFFVRPTDEGIKEIALRDR